jgi:endonuclease III
MNALVPGKERALAHRLIQHGCRVCTARRAFCDRCVLADLEGRRFDRAAPVAPRETARRPA